MGCEHLQLRDLTHSQLTFPFPDVCQAAVLLREMGLVLPRVLGGGRGAGDPLLPVQFCTCTLAGSVEGLA